MSLENMIIRTELKGSEISMGSRGLPKERLRAIKRGLTTLHTLELMAQNIYKFQITKEDSELNNTLIAAMCNEMTHHQDFQTKLYEFSWRPFKLRGIFWIAGFCFGYISRLMGTRNIVKTAIWVESLAVKHYDKLLKKIDWDDDTRAILEKNMADERGHVQRWIDFLRQLNR